MKNHLISGVLTAAALLGVAGSADAVPILNSRGEIARPDGTFTHWVCHTYTDGNGNYRFFDPSWGTPPPPAPFYFLRATTGTDTHLSIAVFNPAPGDVASGRWYLNYNESVPFETATAEVTVLMGLKNGTYAGNLGPMKGFTPTNSPQYTTGTFGPGGTSQFQFTQTAMLNVSQLAAALPGYDLSEWAGATGKVGMFKMSVPLAQLLPPGFAIGDYNANNRIDATDIDAVLAAPAGPSTPATAQFDLNFDGVVNPTAHSPGSDADYYVRYFAMTHYGDANLDRSVDFGDLLTLAQNYGSTTGGWAQGNFDGVQGVEFGDLLALAQNYDLSSLVDPNIGGEQFQSDWKLAQSMVPEPTMAMGLLGFAVTGVCSRRRK